MFFGGLGVAALGGLAYFTTQGTTGQLRDDISALSADVYGTTTTAASANDYALLQSQLDTISATLTGKKR